MKIAILSRNSALYSTRRLKEAGEARGHEMPIIDYLRCYMNITTRNPQVLYQGGPLEGVDAIIPRIGSSNTFYGTAVVRQFEMMDVFTANQSQAISRSRDKLRCLQLLSKQGIGLPVTGFAHSTKDIDGLINVVGGAGGGGGGGTARHQALRRNTGHWRCAHRNRSGGDFRN